MRHLYWLIGIVLLILILFLVDEGNINWNHTTTRPTNKSKINEIYEYESITGILLSGPQQNLWNNRSQHLELNTGFLYGRIYDVSYPVAINWLTSIAIDTQIIVEDDKYQQFGNDFGKLSGALASNPHVQLYPDDKLDVIYTHAKTFFGDKSRVIQTANLNRTSFFDNREHFFLSTNSRIKDDLFTLFTLDKAKIQNPDQITDADYDERLTTISPNLVVCPLNCRQIIEHLLSQAEFRIRISAQYVTDDSLLSLLQDKQTLDLRIRTNKFDANRALQSTLHPKHLLFETTTYNHDKLMVIDDIVLVGSMNMSSNSLDNNREIGIIITDSELIEKISSLFE